MATSPPAASDQPPTRRERQRQATYAEIVAVSRRLMSRQETVSLRAVASAMGMTPPALYRYVDGYEQLLSLVADAVFDDVIATLTTYRDSHPHDDPGAQLVASAFGFRRWALEHRDEFGLVFANHATAESTTLAPDAGGTAFAAFFGDIYTRVWERYSFPVPSDNELPPGLAAGLRDAQAAGTLPCNFPGMPVGLIWIFTRAWARLYGTVTLEVFRHLDAQLIESGAIFRAMMEDNGSDLHLGADLPRLVGLIDSMLELPTNADSGNTGQ